ncbi:MULTISPECIES: GNAT family N-acetyltransferase [unclassified Sphingopyxis]|jgi:RimJ/RimL family protein N-acetyltransferase|uniref:GNAT family N-acetyltransferase n=1 Tax=unclassified Sphingopyxis TaxID=2614943 RepID=UPI0028669437|nr:MULTISPECIES: GNAT family N-acetyltransferase [unclassified Sphingopyxis]MDR7062153.1 RimJ/RimL family protein N-acetyltransferase [Sphingopyxis sp. BE235]MDR7182611.1 RimJ/RimL family protein N-acetyltransferase [Sphingopyxis sp. BE249]
MIVTERLVMRSWRDEDVAPFQAICSDPEVMATLGPPLDMDATQALIERVKAREAEHGHSFWALERREDARLIGWCGVIRGDMGPVADKVEIGWRLARDCWGAGFASEAARGAIAWSFANLPDDEILAITWQGNVRSRAVMERLGMQYCADLDFDHPGLAADNPLRPHVTYSLSRSAWKIA